MISTPVAEYENTITQELDEVEAMLKELGSESGTKDSASQRAQMVKACKIKVQSIVHEMESYSFEISNLERSEEIKQKEIFAAIQARLRIVENEIELKKREGIEAEEQFYEGRKNQIKEEFENKDLNKLDQDQMIKYGKQVQEKGLEKLNAMEGLLEEDIAMADRINLELDEQINRLDSIHADTMDIRTSLKRTGKLIMYFQTQVSTDKILMGLLLLIAIIVLVLLIISFT